MRFSTLGYSIKQGVKNIWRNKMFSLASIATMGACIFLFGIFFAVVINFNYIVKNAETDVSMTVFFNEDVDQATIDEIGTEIKAKTDVVKECKYVSADETWENFAKQYFEGKEEYKDGFKPNDNPLATSAHYEVYVYQVETQDALAEYIRSLDGVREVKQAEGATTTLTTMNRVIGYVSIAIILILLGSFVPLAAGKEIPFVSFIGNKNFAMLVGVLYAALVSRKYLTKSITTIMSEGADQVGLILLITGAGGAFGKILQATGIADYIAGTLSGFSIPILVLCFVICQIIRCAQGSTTVALTTTAAIMAGTIATSGVSPILCAIAICAGGIGLSMPNDSGFWAISRFFGISVPDTIRGWSIGGFVAGVAILIFVSILSLFQGFLPGLM